MLLNELLDTHRAGLDKTQETILENLAARQAAHRAACWPDKSSTSHSAFAEIERIYTQTPVVLFGQDSPSLAHNKLTVRRAVEDENGDLVPGDRLISVLISEQAMTRLLFSSNRGSNETPATAAALDGIDLPAYKKAGNTRDEAFQTSKAKVQKKLDSIIDNLKAKTTVGASAKAKKETLESIDALKSYLQTSGELSFYLQRRQDSYSAKRIDLLSEAAHAALHAQKITDSPLLLTDQRGLDLDSARAQSAMLDGLLDFYTEEETEALAALMALEANRLVETYNTLTPAMFSDANGLKWPENRAVPSYSDAKKDVERTRSLANSVLNPHVKEGRSKLTAFEMGMSITQIHGWSGFLHSSLPATDDTYFTWKIAGAYEEEQFGTSEIRGQHSSTLEFCITSDDMMMLLRGHPTGKPTPVTLRVVGGYYQHTPDIHPKAENSIPKAVASAVRNDPRAKALEEALVALSNHIGTKGSDKAWKEETATRLASVEAAAAAYQQAMEDGFEAGEMDLRTAVGSMVKDQLEEMRAALPDTLLHKLLT